MRDDPEPVFVMTTERAPSTIVVAASFLETNGVIVIDAFAPIGAPLPSYPWMSADPARPDSS